MRQLFVWFCAALLFGGTRAVLGSVPTGSAPADDPSLNDLNLPSHFVRLIADRALIDAYQHSNYWAETSATPAPEQYHAMRNRNPAYVRVVRSDPAAEVLAYRRALPEKFFPRRGFRAPILGRASDFTSPALEPREQEAAALVERRLAHDGLLFTLARVIQVLGPEQFHETQLSAIEFPVDLLDHFAEPAICNWIVEKLRGGASPASLRPALAKVPFRFRAANAQYEVCSESGEQELALLRMQAGGGYQSGIVPGSSLDVIEQVVNAMPQADSLISVPQDYVGPLQWLAARTWKLRRTNHVTLVSEPMTTAAWSQDNGKAGWLDNTPATLAPRYACQDEGVSRFEPGESFLMDGLHAAGHKVIHSALLFQGGNLLALRDPKSGERILLVGEGEIYRNVALGLTPEQVTEAFRTEFAVDRCVVIPAASYHLDFDVTVRAHGEEMTVFLNDNLAAARTIVQLGAAALRQFGAIGADGSDARRIISKIRGKRAALPAELADAFALANGDSGPGNLQTFLLALDLVESNGASGPYYEALRRMLKVADDQAAVFQRLGWKVVRISSMTDLFRSINYLNGLQHRAGYLMPAFGGFYASMDRAAAAKFREALGPEARIQEIRSAQCQRLHGGVHCTVAAYGKPLPSHKQLQVVRSMGYSAHGTQ